MVPDLQILKHLGAKVKARVVLAFIFWYARRDSNP